MKVSEAIRMLKEHHKPDEDIIIAWWDKSYFEEIENNYEWEKLCEHTDNKFDWSGTHDLIQLELDYLLAPDRW